MIWLCLALLADPEAVTGSIRVTGPALNRAVVLRVEQKDLALSGAQVDELQHLASAKVELLGNTGPDGVFKVEGYRILGVSGFDTPPMVGQLELTQPGDALALQDGAGTPIPLSASPAAKARLLPQAGAKIWVYGKKLLSGELKVQVFGILRPVAKPEEPTRRP